jgi:tripartite-type tricarboxylate transporter receptor subunit TctC
MKSNPHVYAAALLAGWALSAAPAGAQNYPERPLRLVVPFAPGASNDIIARAVARKLSEALGQQIVVDNRSGAGGSLGNAIVARAPADGYTLMVTSTSYATSAATQANLPFDPVTDVTGLAIIGRGPHILAVTASLQPQSVKDLVALARAQPGKLAYASSGVGSAPHLVTELFGKQAGIHVTHVPYKGLGPAMADLVAGRVHILIASLPSLWPHVKADRLRALAVTTAQRSAFVPNLPTVVEAGVPGFGSEQWWGLFAPAKLPGAIVTKLNEETRKLVFAEEMKKLLADAGAEPAAMSSSEFGIMMKREIAKWGKVARESGIAAN